MARLLENINNAMTLAVLLALLAMLYFHSDALAAGNMIPLLTFIQTLAVTIWLGMLYSYNLVQLPVATALPAEPKPASAKFYAQRSLLWVRCSSLAAIISSLLITWLNGTLKQGLMLDPAARPTGAGLWLAFIMAFNVWFIIWPNQKKALGLTPADEPVKTQAARAVLLTTRANFILSLPMLYCMVTARLAG